jgi:hypothetical protein
MQSTNTRVAMNKITPRSARISNPVKIDVRKVDPFRYWLIVLEKMKFNHHPRSYFYALKCKSWIYRKGPLTREPSNLIKQDKQNLGTRPVIEVECFD